MNNIQLKWTMGAPEKFEPGMLVFDGMDQYLIGDVDCDGEVGTGVGLDITSIVRWTYLIRDYHLAWHETMAKGK